MVAKRAKKSRVSFPRRPTLAREQGLFASVYTMVAGVDEVGRGAWAGPIVAGAVVLTAKLVEQIRPLSWFKCVNDSKLLTPRAREEVFAGLKTVVPWAVGVLSSKHIDKVGIAAANREAVALAVSNLTVRPRYVLADYVARLGNVVAGVPAEVLVDGDTKSVSIALASIVAKVHRDQLMRAYAGKYRGYAFAEHKGYGTARHAEALKHRGVSPIHRRTYRPVADALVY